MISRARWRLRVPRDLRNRFPLMRPKAQIGQSQFISEGFVSLHSGAWRRYSFNACSWNRMKHIVH